MTGGHERRLDRGSWLALGVVLLLTLASAATAALLLARVGDGCTLDPFTGNVVEACAGDRPTPLRPGDELLAIDGVASPAGAALRRQPAPPGWVAGGTARYTVGRTGQTLELAVPLQRLGAAGILRAFGRHLRRHVLDWNTLVFLGTLVIFALAPRARAAQLLLVAMGGLTAVTTLHAPGIGVGASFAPAPLAAASYFLSTAWGWFFVPTILALVLSFPRRVWPLARRPRLTCGLIYGLPLVATATTFLTTNPAPYLAALGLGALLAVAALVVVPAHTFLRVRDPVARAQTAWLALGLGVGVIVWPLVFVLASLFPGLAPALSHLPPWVGGTLTATPTLAFTACLGIAITRHRLFDIDLVLNRALVWGALTACVVGLYVLVVAGAGTLLRAEGDPLVALAATGLVAVLFGPLRERLQRGANRLVWGERDEPYAVIARLSRRLEGTLAPEATLPAIVETVAGALKLPYAAIALRDGGGFAVAAAAGTPVAEPLRLPLVYGGETAGELLVAPRAPGEAFGPADRRLLEDLARQAGVAAHAVRLTADLRRARERLVAAREEERRRLRRDLHDGLGPTLGSLILKLDVAGDLVDRDPAAARALLAGLKGQTRDAVAEIRRLVHALRPPALDDLGLAGALRGAAAAHEGGALRVAVEVPDRLPPLPAAVEVAAYRIAQEALTNAARHAGARECRVRLTPDADAALLVVEVDDDGRGIPADRRAGVGLASMRERAEEVGGTCVVGARPGGGTRVRATLPCPDRAPGDGAGRDAGVAAGAVPGGG